MTSVGIPGQGQFSAAPNLRIRRWATEVAVYDSALANTHVLSGAIGEVLMVLWAHSGRLSLRDLSNRVFDTGAGDATDLDPQEWDSMNALVDELVRLGLVERHDG